MQGKVPLLSDPDPDPDIDPNPLCKQLFSVEPQSASQSLHHPGSATSVAGGGREVTGPNNSTKFRFASNIVAARDLEQNFSPAPPVISSSPCSKLARTGLVIRSTSVIAQVSFHVNPAFPVPVTLPLPALAEVSSAPPVVARAAANVIGGKHKPVLRLCIIKLQNKCGSPIR
eukprot:CAMPEP_0174959336 /NCGR_PEP_ID=MMETSP0004_2-20121128/3122_1 /TAXON_ID=420556 /ORGANISM="Ochromonas sp., Strain CCMP1393" /LENGTH=171 /DNA_ID=CAMNT_0016207647 /DNA_START=327 /DNA_END=842 /DNA_ORIENTATION=+